MNEQQKRSLSRLLLHRGRWRTVLIENWPRAHSGGQTTTEELMDLVMASVTQTFHIRACELSGQCLPQRKHSGSTLFAEEEHEALFRSYKDFQRGTKSPHAPAFNAGANHSALEFAYANEALTHVCISGSSALPADASKRLKS